MLTRDAARLPWPRLVLCAAIGTIACIAIVVPSNLHTKLGVTAMIFPATQGPSTAVIRADFPHIELPTGVGADGQMFYVTARDAWHVRSSASALDRPRYRDQRVLLPALAWMLHPSGGGRGLVVALVLVNIAGLFIGAVATGALSASFGGSVAFAVLFPLLPGAMQSLNLTTPDALAVALALSAIALDLRGHPRRALIAAIAAVLAKESVLLMLVGYALWRKARQGWLLAAIPAAVTVLWWLVLWAVLPHTNDQSQEFNPLRGFIRTVQAWSHGYQTVAAVAVATAIGLGLIALTRGALRTPFGMAIVLQLAFLLCLDANVLFHQFNGTRATLPLFALAMLAIVATRQRPVSGKTDPDAVSSPRAALVSAR